MKGPREVAVAAEKAALRRRLRAARRALPPEAAARASADASARLARLPELVAARRVLAYAAVPGEVDVTAWVTARLAEGGEVYLPWVDGDDLRIARVTDLDRDLAAGWRGLREPRHTAGDLGADPGGLDAAVVPGVAFDSGGGRLGQGGGHLDRLLARLRTDAAVVGVAFDLAIVPRVPVEPHDVRVDAVVSESRVWRRD